MSVLNIAYFKHRLRMLFGRLPLQWGWHPSEHLRYWSVSDFRWWAEEIGLTVVEVLPANGLTIFGLHRLLPNLLANDVVFGLAEGKGRSNGREE